MDSIKCINPLCIHYYEAHNVYDSSVKPICLYHDNMEINYKKIEVINNCKHHKTYQQVWEERKNRLQTNE